MIKHKHFDIDDIFFPSIELKQNFLLYYKIIIIIDWTYLDIINVYHHSELTPMSIT